MLLIDLSVIADLRGEARGALHQVLAGILQLLGRGLSQHFRFF